MIAWAVVIIAIMLGFVAGHNVYNNTYDDWNVCHDVQLK